MRTVTGVSALALVAVFAAAPIADWYLNLLTPPVA